MVPYETALAQQSLVSQGSAATFRLLNHALDQSRLHALRLAASSGKPSVLFAGPPTGVGPLKVRLRL
jgi:hypothetical protein